MKITDSMSKAGHKIINQSGDTCEIYLYGIIGKLMDIDMDQLIPEIENCRKTGIRNFKFFVNSNGGDVLQCQALWNYLNRSDINVTWVVDGIAASAAYDMMTNPKHIVLMSKYAKVLVHNVSGFVRGKSQQIRQYADVMDTFETEVIDMIANRCGKEKKWVRNNWFDGEDHWLTAQQAIDNKLANEIIDGNYNLNSPPDNLIDPNDVFNFYQNQIINFQMQNNMNQKEIASILNMDVNSDEASVKTALQNLVSKIANFENELNGLKAENQNLKQQLEDANKLRIKNLIDKAIAEKKISVDMRKEYEDMATENYDRTEKIINSLPSIGRIVGQLGSSDGIPEAEKNWTWDDYFKNGKLENLKESRPEHFKELFKAKFNRDYQG
jgi:ATP-dependent protease ClpP protease subunit